MNSPAVKRGRGRPRLYETPEQAQAAAAARLSAIEEDRALRARIAQADVQAGSQPAVEVLLVTLEQAAQALQVSEGTINALLSEHHLTSVRIMGSRRIPLNEIKRLASTGTQL